MFFRERTSDWVEPRIPAGITAALVIAVIGVLYLGIFSNSVIERFSQTTPAVTAVSSR